MAYTMADTSMTRRDYKTGSVFQRSSDGRWLGTIEAGYTANGGRRRITVSASTRSAVLRKIRDKKLELEREGHRNVKRTITVAKWSQAWLDAIQPKVRPSAYETDKAAAKVIVAAIGHIKLGDLSPADVRDVAVYLRKQGKSTSTALRYHGSLMRMLKAASLDGYAIPPNVLLTEKPTKAVSDREAVPVEQAIKALTHIAAMPDGSRWALAFLQGLRQAEALGLTWEQVDLDAGTLTISWQLKNLRYNVKGDPSKGFQIPDGYEARHLVGASHLVRPKSVAGWRKIPLVPWAVSALRKWREIAPVNDMGLVWPGPFYKGALRARNAANDRGEWEAIQKAAKIAHRTGRPYVVHEIRHSTATLLMELGVPESVRIAIMGHSSIAVTHGYEHVDVSQARAALEQMAERLRLPAVSPAVDVLLDNPTDDV
jgi:integrase